MNLGTFTQNVDTWSSSQTICAKAFKQTAIAIGIYIQNKSIAHYTSQKAKYGGLFLSTKIKDLSYIFSLVAKSDMQVSCVIF